MSSHDWRWKINEAIERIRTRYEFGSVRLSPVRLAALRSLGFHPWGISRACRSEIAISKNRSLVCRTNRGS